METQVDHLTSWMTAAGVGHVGENDIVRGSSALAQDGGTPGIAAVPDVISTSMSRLSGRSDSVAMSPLTTDMTDADLVAAADSEEIMAVLKAVGLMQYREPPGQIVSYMSAKRDVIAAFGGATFTQAKPYVQTLLRDGEPHADSHHRIVSTLVFICSVLTVSLYLNSEEN